MWMNSQARIQCGLNDSNSDNFEDDASVDHNDEAHEHEKKTCVNESDEGYKD